MQPQFVATKTFVPVRFPAIRFIPDRDEKGIIKIDKRTKDWASGVLEVTIFESTASGGSNTVAAHREPMTMTKYLAVREEIDSLDVAGLLNYYATLGEQVAAVEPKPAVDPKDAKIEALEKALKEATEKANEKATAADSDKSAGKADAEESGEKDPAEEAKTATPRVTQKDLK